MNEIIPGIQTNALCRPRLSTGTGTGTVHGHLLCTSARCLPFVLPVPKIPNVLWTYRSHGQHLFGNTFQQLTQRPPLNGKISKALIALIFRPPMFMLLTLGWRTAKGILRHEVAMSRRPKSSSSKRYVSAV